MIIIYNSVSDCLQLKFNNFTEIKERKLKISFSCCKVYYFLITINMHFKLLSFLYLIGLNLKLSIQTSTISSSTGNIIGRTQYFICVKLFSFDVKYLIQCPSSIRNTLGLRNLTRIMARPFKG